jgi:hypothetical protein
MYNLHYSIAQEFSDSSVQLFPDQPSHAIDFNIFRDDPEIKEDLWIIKYQNVTSHSCQWIHISSYAVLNWKDMGFARRMNASYGVFKDSRYNQKILHEIETMFRNYFLVQYLEY